MLIVMTSKEPLKVLPYIFAERGVAMLNGILNSNRAIQMNIAIVCVCRSRADVYTTR